MRGLMLHCGAEPISRNELASLPAPVPLTKTHFPIPHIDVISQVEKGFGRLGKFEITDQCFGVSHEGKRMYSISALRAVYTKGHDDWRVIFGTRNAHDMAHSAGGCFGSECFVCDNKAFIGDFVFGRKHTKRITEELPYLIDDCLYQLADNVDSMERRYEHYKEFPVDDKWMHDVVCRSLDLNRDGRQYVIKSAHVTKVLKHWRDPEHQVFLQRNAWSAFNAFTEIQKGIQLNEQSKRTQVLHRLFDEATGILEKKNQPQEKGTDAERIVDGS